MSLYRLQSIRIRNFKAIRDSKTLKLGPLTAFIGNNGSGKSSVLEALETLHTLALRDIDVAMQLWRGIEHVRHKGGRSQTRSMELALRGTAVRTPFSFRTAMNDRDNGNEILFEREFFRYGEMQIERDENSVISFRETDPRSGRIEKSDSLLKQIPIVVFVENWQFLSLIPSSMGNPTPQTRTRRQPRLAKDGSNVAEVLLDIRNRDIQAFNGIVEALQYVLPYAADVQPAITSELERTVYLQMTEQDFKVPGWLLSTGTLRILALLAVLRHPDPPPLILIEELENGLDPRSLAFLVDEIRQVVESGRSQILLTTHSPYLLDLLPLSSIVLVERVGSESIFSRPADEAEVREWAKSFSPGQLYTMNRLSPASKP